MSKEEILKYAAEALEKQIPKKPNNLVINSKKHNNHIT